MDVENYFEMGTSYMAEGNGNLALTMFQECIKRDKMYSPAYLNMYEIFKKTNNMPQAMEAGNKFLNSYMTGRTMDVRDRVKTELENFSKPQQPKVAEPAKK